VQCCEILDPVARPFDFYVLLGTGLTISLGHCVGMCGPLVTAVSIAQRRHGFSLLIQFLRTLIYHSGRIFGYAILGAFMGLIGSTVFLAGQGRQIQGGLSLLVGLVMLLLGLGLLGWLPVSRWVESGPLQRVVAARIQPLLQSSSAWGHWALGLANGFLPCGPVFAATMTAAASGSVWKGALAMFAFGLGTVPVLVALSLGAGRLGLAWRSFFNRLGAVLILFIAAQLILRGLAAWQLVGHLKFGEFVVY